jgi:hypothetical protein
MTRCLTVCFVLAIVSQQADKPTKPPELPDMPAFKQPGADVISFNPNIWIDKNPKGRRVIVRATVCRQEAILEEFMCLKNTKEHESILSADIVPRVFHSALFITEAEPGHPAKYDPDFQPPTGEKLEITVEWKEDGKAKRAKAQDWMRDVRTKKSPSFDFVFAGSQEIKNPVTGEMYYMGNEGDLISVANFAGSIIDLAARSSSVDDERIFETFKERIPPVDTEVFVILKPAAEKKAKTNSDKKTREPAFPLEGGAIVLPRDRRGGRQGKP